MDAITAMFNWISAHEALIAWVFAILSGALSVYAQTKSLKETALQLFLQAEKDHPGKPGHELMEKAIDYALKETVPNLPAFMRPWATRQNVEKFLAWVYKTFRERLEKGAMQSGGDTQAPPQGQ